MAGERESFAVLGGVFDPVHFAHIQLAQEALTQLGVAKVIFLPAGSPPHKTGQVSKPGQRLRMLELALVDEPQVTIDPRELHREGLSYTVHSLRELHREHPAATIYFLIGSDNIPFLKKWHRCEEILTLCTPVVVPRKGITAQFAPEDLPGVSEERRLAIQELTIQWDPRGISSSEVRRRVAAGEGIDDLVPGAVARFIESEGLYRAPSL